jgi:hypothetical protein
LFDFAKERWKSYEQFLNGFHVNFVLQSCSPDPKLELEASDENDERPSSADLSDNDRSVLEGDGNDLPTGRMPSKLSQPVLSRSSYVSNADYSTDSDDESDHILITEVKEIDDDLWRAVNASKRKSVRLHSPAFGNMDEDDGYWDTDLEIDGNICH